MTPNPYGFTQLIVNDAGLSSDVLAELQQSGISQVRVQVLWSVLEPVQGGGYVWTRADNVINQLTALGLRVTFVIQNASSWHLFSPSGSCSGFTYLKAADTAQFALDVMARYGSKLTGIEVGNEGYCDKGAGSLGCNDPTLAIPVMQAVWQALRPLYPNLEIGAPASLTGGGSTGRNNLAFINTWYTSMAQNGGTQWCNYFSHHHYADSNAPVLPSTGLPDVNDWSRIAYQAMVQANIDHGYPIRPMRITESGWTATHQQPPPAGQVDDATQSAYMIQELDAGRLSDGIITHVWFFNITGLVLNWGNNSTRVAYPNLQAYIQQHPQWIVTFPVSDTFSGISGADTFTGVDGTDVFYGVDGTDVFYGINGTDTFPGIG